MATNVGLGNLVESKNELLSHNFDIFSNGGIEKAMSRGYEQEVHPIVAVTNDGPYVFYIPPGTDYLFLPHTRLYLKLKITTDAGANIAAAVNYSTTNLFPQTLFKQVEVEIGGVAIPAQNDLYPYKAFFETLFSYSETAKNSHLKACSGWYPDTPGQQDTLGDDNEGYENRKKLVTGSKTVDFCFPIHADIFQCAKLVPPNTSLRLTLTRNVDVFSVLCDNAEDLKISFLHASLFIRKIAPTDSIRSLYETKLLRNPVILPFSRSIIKRTTLGTGTLNANIPVVNGELPRQILLCFVGQQRLNGRKNLNPFKFDHFDVQMVNLRIDGVSDPGRPFEPDINRDLFARELRALYDNTGILTGDSGYSITREDFKNGLTFFAWDNTPDHCNGFHDHEKKLGRNIDLELTFRTALTENINVIFYLTYETDVKLLNGQCIEANFVNG